MARLLRTTLMIAAGLVMAGALGLATMRGDLQRLTANVLPADLDLSSVATVFGAQRPERPPPQTVPLLEPVNRPTAGRFAAFETRDFTAWTRDADYTPDPTQGTRHKTDRGQTWWGAGPTDGPKRPVVLLLHGAGRTGHSMVDMWYETATRHDLILVAPDMGGVPAPGGLPDPAAMLDALDHAATLYPVDREHVVLFGHSRGATVAQAWANRYAGPWKAVAGHAGTLPAEVVQGIADGVPIRHYLGSVDHIFPFADANASGRAMAAAGHPFDLVRLDGHNHWFYETGEAIAADAWLWLSDDAH